MPEPKYSTQEFAQIIKQKYPQYANVEDNALVSKILEKYPQYSSSVDLGLKKKDEQQLDTSMVTEESMVSESQLDGKKEPTLSYVGSRQVAVSPDVVPTEEAFVGARPAPKPMTAEDRRATLEAARESQANNFMNIARNTLGAVAEGAVGLNTYLNRGVELLLLGNQTNYFSSGSAAIGESIQRDKEKLQAEYIGEETVGKPITQTFIEDPVKGAKLVAFEASRLIPQMYALGAAGRSTFPSTTVAGKALETGTLLSPRTKLATEIMSEAGPIIPLGLSAAGTSYAETVKENPEDDIIDAITNYAVASYKGAGEIASELLFRTSVDDLIRGGFRKNLISDIAKADKPVLQALKGTAKKTGTEAFQEGIEELAVEISNNAIDGLVFGEDMLSSNNIYGMADAFILGAGIGGPVTLLSQGPSSIGVANEVNKRKKIAEEVNDLYDQHQNGNLNAADKSIVRGQIINKLAELKKVENNLSDFYSEFSEEDQQEVLKANQIISMGQLLYEDSNSDVAKEAIADFVAQAYSDKTKVEAKYSPNIKVYEYDSEEEAGVPSPIQEREAPIATELEQGPSAEAPEAGGVLQVPAEEGQKVGDLINTRIVYTDPISETIIEGELIQDGQRLVLEEDSGRQIDIGNVEELSGQAVGEIQVEGQTVTLQKATETLVPQEDGSLVYNLKGNQKIPFKTKMFNRQEGLKAIKRNKAGDVTRVTLQNEQGTETYNLTGREAEDAAYYLLRDFANNMELARLEQLIQQNEEVRAELERATAIAEAPVVAEEAAVPVAEEAVQPRVERGVIQESITKAERVLNKLIPEAGVKIVTHNTKAEFDAAMDRVSMRGAIKDAIEYGRFIPSRNEIHINFENADAEAALHEAFHAVFVNKFGKQSQEQREKTATEFESGIKKVLNSGTAQDIDLAKEMDRFVKDGGYSAEEAPEEFLAQLAGFMGANYIKLSKPTQNKLIQWINNFIGKFFSSLKIKTPNEFVDFMNSFAAAANEQVETSEESRPLTPSPIEISPELFPEKSSKGAFDTEGTYLANEPKVNIKDLFTAFKAENNRNPNVWIWMSDQLKRGQYVNPETGVTLDLEGGIGFAFDPKNREQNVVWSSGLSQKTLQDRIGKSDFIWFMSGSPLTSFNFSKGTTKAIIAEIEAGLEKFKGKSLEGVRIKDASFEEFVKIADKFLSEEKYKNVKKWEGINSALTKYKSGIIDHPSRMKVAENLLHEGAGKKMQIPIQQFLHQTLGVPTKDVFHSLLRDEALIKNNIANGDLTLLVKPTGIIDNAGLHDTYPHAITGDVIGMPEQIYNVLDVVPEDAKKVISKETGLPLEKPSAPAQIKTAVGDVGRIYESEELSTNSVYGTMIKESSSKTTEQLFDATKAGLLIHATKGEFDMFNPEKIYGASRAVYGYGFYFTGWAPKAKDYGNKFIFTPSDKYNLIDVENKIDSEFVDELIKKSDKEARRIFDQLKGVDRDREYAPYLSVDVIVKEMKSMLADGKSVYIDDVRKRLDNRNELSYQEFSEAFKFLGYDGFSVESAQTDYYEVIIFNVEKLNENLISDEAEYVAKQELNNAFLNTIKESSSKQFIEGQQQSQIDNEVDNTVAESKEWKEKERNSFERFSDLARLKIQDKFRDIIRMQENIELATDKPVGLDQDFRNAETLMYGKAAKDLQDSEEKVKNISDLIKQSGLSIEEFNDLLYALHAQERNRYIRLISTNIGESLTNLRKANNLKVADVAEAVGIEVEDYKDIESTGKLTDIELKNILDLYGKSEADFFYENALVKDGSGMTDQEAQSILAENGVKNLVNPSVKELPSKVGKAVSAVHNLIQDTRDVMLRDGLETPETISVFDTVYKNYVPLQGFADEEGLGDYNVEVLEGGRKLEVRGRIKEAKGRTTKADSPLVQAVMQNTNTIIRGRKNEVMQKLYNLAKENPNKDVWEVIDPEVNKEYKKAKKDGKISLVAKTISDYMLDPSMVAVRVNGEYKFIRFTDSRMAETLRGATVASTDFIVKFLGRFNRLLSSFITTYDPEFVLRNFSRDIQTAVLNAYSEQELNDGLIKGEKIVASIIKSVPKSIKAIFAIEGGKDVTTEYDKYYKEFVEDGGKTAWFYSKGSEELSNDIQSLLDGKKDSALKLAGNFVERVNTSVENGVRLSAYIESRKAGISREKAAEFAKNLTVNFNKSGEWGTLANSLYLFFNASVQGTSRLIRTLKPQFKTNDDGTRSLQVTNAQKIVVGIAVLGAIMSMINEALSDDDEDGKSFYSKIPDFEKERNIIIMKPNGKGYFKIPLPYGVNVFYVLGGSMADASQGVQGKGEAITNVLQASIGSFSPINFPNSDDPARWITKLLTPTIGQIPVGLALNEDYFGRTIYNDNFPFDKSPKPASELGREGGDWAKWLNKATGGSEFRSGFIDINPDKTDFILETLSGGAGRFVLRSTKSIGSLISGNWDELEPREIPFARVFYGQPSKYINQYDYYEKQVLVNQLAEEAKAGIISGKEKSSVLKMAAINKAVASNLRKYKKLEDAASNIKDPEKKEARLNQLERLRYAEIARFQKIYEKLNIDDIK
jgi:transcriptional regulator with XRE-family HTH domain